MNGMSVKQCAQCGANLIAAEWSEHLSDHCVRNVWSCDACVLPGTELAFEDHVQYHHALSRSGIARVNHKVARFRQVNLDNPHVHHDALEFPGGEIVMVTHLVAGQKAIVLQLPARPLKEPETRAEKAAAYVR